MSEEAKAADLRFVVTSRPLYISSHLSTVQALLYGIQLQQKNTPTMLFFLEGELRYGKFSIYRISDLLNDLEFHKRSINDSKAPLLSESSSKHH
jgi:hypothetical protein